MNRYNGWSSQDIKEMYEDACASYQAGSISLVQFSSKLAELGYNATDIAEAEKFYRPAIPENDGD